MRLFLLIGALSTASGALSQTADDQFNLSCKGTSMTFSGTGPPSAAVPWSREFRVDLSERSYCEDACSEVRRLVRISPDELRFRDDGDEVSYVNRSNGRMTVVSNAKDAKTYSPMTISATCTRNDFSGFGRKF